MTDPSRYVDFALYGDDGMIRRWGRCSADMVEAQIDDNGFSVRLHDKGDDIVNYRIGKNGRLVRKSAAYIDIDVERMNALVAVDAHFSHRLATSPFAEVHRAKRQQAEAGGGSLIADERDRLAVLERAAEQDNHIAKLEADRIAIKRQVRAAKTASQIADILQSLHGEPK